MIDILYMTHDPGPALMLFAKEYGLYLDGQAEMPDISDIPEDLREDALVMAALLAETRAKRLEVDAPEPCGNPEERRAQFRVIPGMLSNEAKVR